MISIEVVGLFFTLDIETIFRFGIIFQIVRLSQMIFRSLNVNTYFPDFSACNDPTIPDTGSTL